MADSLLLLIFSSSQALYQRFLRKAMYGYQSNGKRYMLLAGGYGNTNGKPQIDKTSHLKEAYEFGKTIYKN